MESDSVQLNSPADADGDAALTARIWAALDTVMDPEIPSVSLVELGVIDEVRLDDGRAHITMIPTFSGCPALDVMRRDLVDAVSALGLDAEVFIARKPWSTDRMSDSAREKMKLIGLAPPQRHGGNVEWEIFSPVPCPWCASMDTTLENGFGPTLCRAIWYCNACRQSFEKFKAL